MALIEQNYLDFNGLSSYHDNSEVMRLRDKQFQKAQIIDSLAGTPEEDADYRKMYFIPDIYPSSFCSAIVSNSSTDVFRLYFNSKNIFLNETDPTATAYSTGYAIGHFVIHIPQLVPGVTLFGLMSANLHDYFAGDIAKFHIIDDRGSWSIVSNSTVGGGTGLVAGRNDISFFCRIDQPTVQIWVNNNYASIGQASGWETNGFIFTPSNTVNGSTTPFSIVAGDYTYIPDIATPTNHYKKYVYYNNGMKQIYEDTPQYVPNHSHLIGGDLQLTTSVEDSILHIGIQSTSMATNHTF